jgi:CBS-domain-containing membrane protein
MSQIRDVMTRDVRTVHPDTTLRVAAQCMDELNVGVLPVCDGERLVGMVTDRDITVRGVAQGKTADQCPVSEVMSASVRSCREDQEVDDVLDEMSDVQIRRLPVVDHHKRLVGIVSLGDLSERGGEQRRVAEALRGISSPSQPDRH